MWIRRCCGAGTGRPPTRASALRPISACSACYRWRCGCGPSASASRRTRGHLEARTPGPVAVAPVDVHGAAGGIDARDQAGERGYRREQARRRAREEARFNEAPAPRVVALVRDDDVHAALA